MIYLLLIILLMVLFFVSIFMDWKVLALVIGVPWIVLVLAGWVGTVVEQAKGRNGGGGGSEFSDGGDGGNGGGDGG